MKMKTQSIVFMLLVMLMVTAGCAKTEMKVTVASKPHTEQYILAEIISQLIENKTDIKVERKMGIGGGTSNIHPAMLNGDIDIYPEYTGTAWLFVLKEDQGKTKELMYDALKKAYSEKFHIKWLGRYGFNNTYTLALPEKIAVDNNINTFSELANASSQYVLGAEYDFFEREDGYKGLSKMYGFNFKNTKEIDIGLKYVAIASKKVDVINAFSTDGLLLKEKLRVLKDDRNYFPTYEAATLIREETLKKYPELDKLLGQLTGKISDEKMIKMNYAVEIEKKDPSLVAKEFLREEGMIK
ncbi:glycine betaine ABC transporter substrate-binding protein [uncultured Anaeromusa sp.]|uniref:glycine betaine ABC transporter substrate-binding protein n=1 Tax=uncultured Anaeromusa sp. TaxID=673273 RepID=UPI0029C71508|nr:glycine betaine ABC transporter substrate-binding protein [uncultured Anaeromusa sp.]